MAPSEFVDYLRSRHSRGESWRAIADSFGVSRQALDLWRSAFRRPSRTVLILAALLARQDAGRWPME